MVDTVLFMLILSLRNMITTLSGLLTDLKIRCDWTKFFSQLQSADKNRIRQLENGLKLARSRLDLIEAAAKGSKIGEVRKALSEKFEFDEKS